MALLHELEQQGNWLFRYRGILPVAIFIIGIAVYVEEITEREALAMDASFFLVYEFVCLAVGVFGLVIRCYTVGHTPRNTSGRNTAHQIADSLNTTGAYSLVRHPLYVGNFFMWLGVALLTQHFWFIAFFVIAYIVYYERIMFAEEQFLKQKLGEAYMRWASKTPAYLPYGRSSFVTPEYPFSWKKVLKKEKNGLTALLVIFAVFNLIRVWVHGEGYNYYILIAAALSLPLYFILKYLKRNTMLLDEAER